MLTALSAPTPAAAPPDLLTVLLAPLADLPPARQRTVLDRLADHAERELCELVPLLGLAAFCRTSTAMAGALAEVRTGPPERSTAAITRACATLVDAVRAGGRSADPTLHRLRAVVGSAARW